MKKKYKVVNFTLIELLMAMSILLIISVIMMRFSSSAQQIWSNTAQRNAVYADARIALDLMARELQTAMYNNVAIPTPSAVRSIYPFWFQYLNIIDQQASNMPKFYENFEWKQINFIANTFAKPSYADSNLCAIRYSFVPAGGYVNTSNEIIKPPDVGSPGSNTSENWDGWINPTKDAKEWEGWLIRSVTADIKPDNNPDTEWNFKDKALKDTTGTNVNPFRVNDVFKNTSNKKWQKIIPGVYSLQFTCYGIKDGYNIKIKSLKSDGNLGLGDAMFTTDNTNLWVGTPFPIAIKIDLELFASKDWFMWRDALIRAEIAKKDGKPVDEMRFRSVAEKIKNSKLRPFTKTVFLENKVSY